MRTERVGLKTQVAVGDCRVSVSFQLTFVRGSSTAMTLCE